VLQYDLNIFFVIVSFLVLGVHPQACGGTPLSGQHRRLFSPLEKRDNAEDEDDDDYEDAGDDLHDCDDLMSRMSVNDQHEEDSFSVITGYRSSKSSGGRASHRTNNNSTITSDSSKSFSYGCSNINLPYVMDIWRDMDPKDRCSVQVHLLSGRGGKNKLRARVSTDGRFLVLEGTYLILFICLHWLFASDLSG
jgi:hypothetical protein